MQPIGVVVLITNSQNQLLCGKRLHSYGAGLYGFPGGRVEVGEPLAQTAIREVLEETGLVLTEVQYVGVVRETQKDTDFIHFVFHTTHYVGNPELKEPEKCAGWEWRLPNEVTMLLGHKAASDLLSSANSLIDLTV